MAKDDDTLILHVGDQSFNAEDLTFGEQREIRRLVRKELWEEDVMGPFDWAEVPNDEVIAATIAVWTLRETAQDPARPTEAEFKAALDDALKLKPADVYRQNGNGGPPTRPARSSARKKTSAASGPSS